MLEFLKKIFCAAEPAETPAPYKIESTKVQAVAPAKTAKPKAEKKPVAKAPRKPRTPKA
jgi:hypothetical protein